LDWELVVYCALFCLSWIKSAKYDSYLKLAVDAVSWMVTFQAEFQVLEMTDFFH
jgi:hypothetical protein